MSREPWTCVVKILVLPARRCMAPIRAVLKDPEMPVTKWRRPFSPPLETVAEAGPCTRSLLTDHSTNGSGGM